MLFLFCSLAFSQCLEENDRYVYFGGVNAIRNFEINKTQCEEILIASDEQLEVEVGKFILTNNQHQADQHAYFPSTGFFKIIHSQTYFKKNQKVIETFQLNNTKICFIIEEQNQEQDNPYLLIDCTFNSLPYIKDNEFIISLKQRSYFKINLEGQETCSQFEQWNKSLYFLCKNQSTFSLKRIQNFFKTTKIEIETIITDQLNSTQQVCQLKYLINLNQVQFILFSCQEWAHFTIKENQKIIQFAYNQKNNLKIPNHSCLEKYYYCQSSIDATKIIIFAFKNLYIQYIYDQNIFTEINITNFIEYIEINLVSCSNHIDLLMIDNNLFPLEIGVEKIFNQGLIKECKNQKYDEDLIYFVSYIHCKNSLIGIFHNQFIVQELIQFEMIDVFQTSTLSYLIAINNTDLFFINLNMMRSQIVKIQEQNVSYFIFESYRQTQLGIPQYLNCFQVMDQQNESQILIRYNFKSQQPHTLKEGDQYLKLQKNSIISNQIVEIGIQIQNKAVKTTDSKILFQGILDKLKSELQRQGFQEYTFFSQFKGFIFFTFHIQEEKGFELIFFQGNNYSLIIYQCQYNKINKYPLDIELKKDTILQISSNRIYLILDRSRQIVYKLNLNKNENQYNITKQITFDVQVNLFNFWNTYDIIVCLKNLPSGIMFNYMRIHQQTQTLIEIPEIDFSKIIRVIQYQSFIKIIQTVEKIFVVIYNTITQIITTKMPLMSFFLFSRQRKLYAFEISLIDIDEQQILIYYVTNYGSQLRTKIPINFNKVFVNPLYFKYQEEYLALLVQNSLKTKYFIMLYDLQKSRLAALKDIIEIANPFFEMQKMKIFYINYENQFIEYDILEYTFPITELVFKNITNILSLNLSVYLKEEESQKIIFHQFEVLDYVLINQKQEISLFNNGATIKNRKIQNFKINLHDFVSGNIDSTNIINNNQIKLINPVQVFQPLKCQYSKGYFCINNDKVQFQENLFNFNQFYFLDVYYMFLLDNDSTFLIISKEASGAFQIELYSKIGMFLNEIQKTSLAQNLKILKVFQNINDLKKQQLLIQTQSEKYNLGYFYFYNGHISKLIIEHLFHDLYLNEDILQPNCLVNFCINCLEFVIFTIKMNQFQEIGRVYFYQQDYDLETIYVFNLLFSPETKIKIINFLYINGEGSINFINLDNQNPIMILQLSFHLKNGTKNVKLLHLLMFPNEHPDLNVAFVNQEFLILQSASLTFYVYQLRKDQQEGYYCYSQNFNSSLIQINYTHLYWLTYQNYEHELHFANPQPYQIQLIENMGGKFIPLLFNLQNQVSEVTLHLNLTIEKSEIITNIHIAIVIFLVGVISIISIFFIRRYILKKLQNIKKVSYDVEV